MQAALCPGKGPGRTLQYRCVANAQTLPEAPPLLDLALDKAGYPAPLPAL